jgi:hypothetical protein
LRAIFANARLGQIRHPFGTPRYCLRRGTPTAKFPRVRSFGCAGTQLRSARFAGQARADSGSEAAGRGCPGRSPKLGLSFSWRARANLEKLAPLRAKRGRRRSRLTPKDRQSSANETGSSQTLLHSKKPRTHAYRVALCTLGTISPTPAGGDNSSLQGTAFGSANAHP